jgi:hypothetical protein
MEARKIKKPKTYTCKYCSLTGATLKVEPLPPDYQAWWFHRECYWKLQDLLY